MLMSPRGAGRHPPPPASPTVPGLMSTHEPCTLLGEDSITPAKHPNSQGTNQTGMDSRVGFEVGADAD